MKKVKSIEKQVNKILQKEVYKIQEEIDEIREEDWTESYDE